MPRTDTQTQNYDYEAYKADELFRDETPMPHNATALLKAWKSFYGEQSELRARDCDILLECDMWGCEYIRTTRFDLCAALTAICDYLSEHGARQVSVSLSKIGKSVFVLAEAKTEEHGVVNAADNLDELHAAAEGEVHPCLQLAFSEAAMARSVLRYTHAYNGNARFELELNGADIGTLGFKSIESHIYVYKGVSYVRNYLSAHAAYTVGDKVQDCAGARYLYKRDPIADR